VTAQIAALTTAAAAQTALTTKVTALLDRSKLLL